MSTRREAEEALRKAARELAKRAEAASKVDFAQLSFGPQRDFIEDDSRFLVGICGRRAGKTDGMALKLLNTASRIPRCQVFYITLSRPAAKRILWPKLILWNEKLQLDAKFNHAELTMTLKNGSIIMLGGANDEGEIERYRGVATPLFVLDEAQAFRSFLKPMIEQILIPATIDYRGQIAMIGTPNPSCVGYFHDASTGKEAGWSVHHWTIWDNPHIPHAEEEIAELRQRMRWTGQEPQYRREYLGEWVRDSSGLVFPIPDWAIVPSLPEGNWSYVLGVDIGYVDATAFVVMAYDPAMGKAFVVRSYQATEMIPSRIAAEVERLQLGYDFESIVIDPGGGGKLIVEELKQRYGVPAQVAQKRGKDAFIDLLNGDLRSGTLSIVGPGNEELLHDAALLTWDYSRIDENTAGGHAPKDLRRIDDRTPDHLLDAMLYGFRECKAWINRQDVESPSPGSAAWLKELEEQLFDSVLKKVEGQDDPWWEEGF